jgi:hypothetical protein
MNSAATILIGLLAIFEIANSGESTSVGTTTDELSSVTIGTDPGRRARRLVVSDQECTLYKMSMESSRSIAPDGRKIMKSGEIDKDDDDDDEWHCEFDKEYTKEILGLEDPLVRITGWTPGDRLSNTILEDEDEDDVIGGIQSGKSTMKFSQGIIDRQDNTMYVDSTFAEVVVNDDRRELQSSEIIPIVGVKTVIIVRILTNDYGISPSVTGREIKNFVFNYQVSLARKYKECSHNQLKFRPFEGTTKGEQEDVVGGVQNVRLNAEQSEELKEIIRKNGNIQFRKAVKDRINLLARIAADRVLGDLESQFDHVLFVIPRGIFGVYATATINRWDSYYTEDWILRPSILLHEIGHNLGMDHAGENNEYDDKVGYMGFSYDNYFGPSMCFNPANSYYLGWYQEQTASYDALESGNDGNIFSLIGVNDYNPATAGFGDEKLLVVLRLTHSKRNWDYYVGYNRQKGMNRETSENGNNIVIMKKGGPAGTSQKTQKIGTLSTVGTYFEIGDYNKEQSVFISFERKMSMGKDAVIRISTARPTSEPSSQPSTAPSPEPTRNPTSRPTRAPTPRPTFFGEIVDLDRFLYQGFKNKDCAWVNQKPEDRCGFKFKRKKIKDYWCPKTCQNVTPIVYCGLDDRNSLAYKRDKSKNCAWVAEDKERNCIRNWKKEKISEYWCQTTCADFCLGPVKKPKKTRRRQTNLKRL